MNNYNDIYNYKPVSITNIKKEEVIMKDNTKQTDHVAEYDCVGCNSKYTRVYDAPFCSERCSDLFHDFASIQQINQVYKEWKKDQAQ